MKKNIKMAMIAAFYLILAVSCHKELSETAEVSETGKTFTATIEQDFTKTTLSYDSEQNVSKVMWDYDDGIDINGTLYGPTPLDPASKAIFTKWWGNEPTAPYHAIYPSSLRSGNGYEFPADREYVSGRFNAPMYAESNTENLSFKNICGVLCFSLKGTDKVKRISVTANEAICGAFTIADDYKVNLTGTGKTVTLYCGQEGVQLNNSTPTDFYIYLPPGEYASGMKITVTNTEEDVFEKVTKAAADIDRSVIYTFDWDAEFSPVLAGRFSVGEGKTVSFSQGNLHATKVGENWIMGFYERQMEVNPIATVTNSTVNGTRTASSNDKEIDLFTWSYGSDFTTDPTTLSYGSIFSDWGSKIGSGNTWRTLSSEEWSYLLGQRSNAAGLYKSDVTVCGVDGCLVIAPDIFEGTIAASYDNAAWKTAEVNGLVCLPPAGHRYGCGVDNTGRLGFYWTGTSSDAGKACSLSLSKEGQSSSTQIYAAVPGSSPVGCWSDPEGQATVNVTGGDSPYYEVTSTSVTNSWDSWSRQVQFYGVDNSSLIKNGSNCVLKVRAKTAAGFLEIVPFLQGDKGGAQYQGCNFPTLTLSEEWQHFEVQLISDLDAVQNLGFNVGNTEGKTVYLADVEICLTTSEQSEVLGAQGFPSDNGGAFGTNVTSCKADDSGIWCYQMTNAKADVSYLAKYQIEFPAGTFEAGKKCRIRLKAKASGNKSITCYLVKSLNGQYPNCGTFPSVELTTTWQDFVIETNCTDSDATAIAFDFGDFEGTICLAEFSAYNLVEIPYAADTEDGVGTAANDRKYGLSVRLVRDVNPAAKLKSLNDSNYYDIRLK